MKLPKTLAQPRLISLKDKAFTSLNLTPHLQDNLATLGYSVMTPIQMQSLPTILARKDVIAQAKTGSGKTAAFGLGILSALTAKNFHVQALVLCPTRELSDQVAREIRRLARGIGNIKVLVLCGGRPAGPQVTSIRKGVHIVVGTPGRIEDHLKRKTLSIKNVQTLVLDEADRMLQMGFQDSIDAIVNQVPGTRQTLLLSATYPQEIASIASRVMHDPKMIVVDEDINDEALSQHFYEVQDGEDRIQALATLLAHYQPQSALIFCNTKQRVRELTGALKDSGLSVIALHGDLSQRERDQGMVRFINRSVQLMVATDVAARGLDISDLEVVVNFNVAHDQEVHVHRIGRTGRAGKTGIVWTFYSQLERKQFTLLQNAVGGNIVAEPLPRTGTNSKTPIKAEMITLKIEGGKKQKLRPGDILGALTGKDGIDAGDVGKITIEDTRAFVAVNRQSVKTALQKLSEGKIKGRSFRVRSI